MSTIEEQLEVTKRALADAETDRDRWMRIATDLVVEQVHAEAVRRFERYLEQRTAELGIPFVSKTP